MSDSPSTLVVPLVAGIVGLLAGIVGVVVATPPPEPAIVDPDCPAALSQVDLDNAQVSERLKRATQALERMETEQ